MLGSVAKYELIEILGSGGQGTVFRAQDTTLNRMVALKVVRQDKSHDLNDQTALLNEARAAARLNHPNIITLFEAGFAGNQLYLAMELAPFSLANKMESGKPWNYLEVVPIAISVCQALAHCHNHDVIHKDIKPQNILLTNDGQPKLADFGLARPAETTTMRTSIGGTLTYMSPEQIDVRSVDGRSDIYSLGVVLYHMLTGNAPFTGDSDRQVLNAHVNDPVPPMDSSLGVPVRLEEIVRKALAKRPDDRFTDALDMSLELGVGFQGLSGSIQTPSNQPPAIPRTPSSGLIITTPEDEIDTNWVSSSPSNDGANAGQNPPLQGLIDGPFQQGGRFGNVQPRIHDGYSQPISVPNKPSLPGRITYKVLGAVLVLWGTVLLLASFGTMSGGEAWQGIVILIGSIPSISSGILCYTKAKLGTSSKLAELLAPKCTVKNVLGLLIIGFVIFIIGISNTST